MVDNRKARDTIANPKTNLSGGLALDVNSRNRSGFTDSLPSIRISSLSPQCSSTCVGLLEKWVLFSMSASADGEKDGG